jgi:hypothetical protein
MTTKPKTRKVPATKAATSTTGKPKREVSEIRTLVSRYKWLDADQNYQATTADTEQESELLIAIHFDEQEKIGRELATLIPESFWDACCLLGFATDLSFVPGSSPLVNSTPAASRARCMT